MDEQSTHPVFDEIHSYQVLEKQLNTMCLIKKIVWKVLAKTFECQVFDKMHIWQVFAKTFEYRVFDEMPTRLLCGETTIIKHRF